MTFPIPVVSALPVEESGAGLQDIQHYMRDGTLQLSALPPLSLYVHLPWCLKKCPYCDFNSHETKGELPERRYLAEILWGFLDRDYLRVAEVHFRAGYVPAHHDRAAFAQALRAVGEPVFGRAASQVSTCSSFCRTKAETTDAGDAATCCAWMSNGDPKAMIRVAPSRPRRCFITESNSVRNKIGKEVSVKR